MAEIIDNVEVDETVKFQSAHSGKSETETVDSKGDHKKRKHDDNAEFMKGFARGDYGPDYERRKAEIHREINLRVIKPEDMVTGKTWEKTAAERAEVKMAKAKHNALLRSYGVDPKKQINLLPGDSLKLEEFKAKETKKQKAARK
ncbi:MAG: hypothetical protein M0R51_07760 [Clostridia bacterium]|jgi:hypothetical protein|nr:hypothetical protein [Clostridia bacterium]